MATRFRSWWQQIKTHRATIGAVAIVLAVIIALIIVGYRFDWTGFNGNNKSSRTLWDWMQLLFIPVVLAVAGFWFNHRERKAAELRAEAEREIEQKRAEKESDIAVDNQREDALQAYIDKISELLLHDKLSELLLDESSGNHQVVTIALARTTTVLRILDQGRRGSLVRFLSQADIITKCIKDELVGIDLSGADLTRIDLSKTNLSGANFSEANLSEAILTGANLQGANLKDAKNITTEELEKQAKSLTGATMPDGSIHP